MLWICIKSAKVRLSNFFKKLLKKCFRTQFLRFRVFRDFVFALPYFSIFFLLRFDVFIADRAHAFKPWIYLDFLKKCDATVMR